MSVKIKKISIPKGSRIIAVSDIHGNLDCFERLMKKVGFCNKDILVIIGDFVEKGPENLKTLRTMIELSKQDNIHIICGNCEIIWKFIKDDSLDSWFLPYSLSKRSLIEEMCEEISIKADLNTDLDWLKRQLAPIYHNELEWLENLPVILETDDYIFVHAALMSENLCEQSFFRCVKTDGFLDRELSFEKYVIAGHFPTNNYHKNKAEYNPIIDREKHIVSIDGGNVVENCGQLNALIISDTAAEPFSFEYCDSLPIGTVMKAQDESLKSINISWIDNRIEVYSEGDEFSFCRHIPTGYELFIPNKYIYETGGSSYCYDITDYHHSVKKGELVSVIDVWSDRYLAKKNGVVGWIIGQPGFSGTGESYEP